MNKYSLSRQITLLQVSLDYTMLKGSGTFDLKDCNFLPGCASVGITVTMVNPLANLAEITYQLELTKARALFVFPMFAQNAYNAKKEVPRIRDIFLYGKSPQC